MRMVYVAKRSLLGGETVTRMAFDNILGAADAVEYWAEQGCSCSECHWEEWEGNKQKEQKFRPAHSAPGIVPWVVPLSSECGDKLYVEVIVLNQGRGPGYPCA